MTGETRRMPRILLVEDDENLRRILARTLSRAGYLVGEISDGSGLLRELRTGGWVDLVVTDLMMDGLDGESTIETVHMVDPSLRVLVLSGADPRRLAEAGRHPGVVGVLRKPVPPSELLHVISGYVPLPGDAGSSGA